MTPDQIKKYLLDQANGLVPTLDQFQTAVRNTVNPVTNKSGQVRDAIQNEKKPAQGGLKMSIYDAKHNTNSKTTPKL